MPPLVVRKLRSIQRRLADEEDSRDESSTRGKAPEIDVVRQCACKYRHSLLDFRGPRELLNFSSFEWDVCGNELSKSEFAAKVLGMLPNMPRAVHDAVDCVQDSDVGDLRHLARQRLDTCEAYSAYLDSVEEWRRCNPRISMNGPGRYPYKKRTCAYFARGRCDLGQSCTFLHGAGDPILQVRALTQLADEESSFWTSHPSQAIAQAQARVDEHEPVGRLQSFLQLDGLSLAPPKTKLEKLVLRLKKKLREIAHLDDAAAQGKPLNANQLASREAEA